MFFVRHIDSILQVLIGIFITGMAFRRAADPTARSTKVLRFCGPALIVIGSILLLKPGAPASWQRQFTADKVASAEFPGAATAKESTDTLGTVTVKRTSFTYNVPDKDISLFLSYSALPAE